MFDRVFVANRATVARRVLRACDKLGVETVAAYADIDSASPHLAEAAATARLPGYLAADTYLNRAKLIQLARENGCDALHPGYGFLAENAISLAKWRSRSPLHRARSTLDRAPRRQDQVPRGDGRSRISRPPRQRRPGRPRRPGGCRASHRLPGGC